MKNQIQDGNIIDVVASADVLSGDLYAHGKLVGIATTDAKAGEKFALQLYGVFEVPKAAGAITAGAFVYYDATAKNATTTASGNTQFGHATEAAASGDATAIVRLYN